MPSVTDLVVKSLREKKGPLRMSSAQPVFLDRKGRRSLYTNVALGLGGLFTLAGLCIVLLGVVVAPALPRLDTSDQSRAQLDGGKEGEELGPLLRSSGDLPIKPGMATRSFQEQAPLLRFAFVNPNDSGSLASLQRHAGKLDAVIVDCLTLEKSADGVRLGSDPESSPHLGWLARSAPRVQVFPSLASQVTATQIAEMLASTQHRAILIEEITSYLQRHKSAGVTIDLSSTLASTHRHLVLFLTELRFALGSEGRLLIVSLDAEAPRARLQQLAKAADYVLLKAHDQTWERQPAGPVAAQGWFEARVSEFASKVGRDKLIVTIGSFGYEWVHGIKELVPVQYVWEQLALRGGQMRFDVRSLNPVYEFRADDVLHEVWYLDAVTAFNQLRVAFSIRPAGLAVWRLGLEDPGVWSLAGRGRFPDDDVLGELSHIEPGRGAFRKASGHLLAIGADRSGKRTLTYSPDNGLITSQTVDLAPRQASLAPLPSLQRNDVALTFDDGPSADHTGRILDILREKSAKATFYVIGANALMHPGLLRRIYEEGHDVGSHSFSHPNLFTGGYARIVAELNATQRVLESHLGVRTVLFRPPYMTDNYSRLETAPDLVRAAFELGYVFAGYDVDPKDYLFASSPSSIVKRSLDEVERGGRVILLHDSGGQRKATTEALPILIDELRARGFRLVTTSELVGRSRDSIMPPVGENAVSRIEMDTRRASAGVILSIGSVLPALAVVTAMLGMIRISLIAIGAVVHSRRDRSRRRVAAYAGKIAVVVPAYNEEKVICKTIETVLSSTVRDRLEIIVVDDGSVDATSAVVRNAFDAVPQVRVYKKQNGGKASALNYGIQRAEADVIVAIDGDTVLLPDAIERLTDRFADPSVGAVAGMVLVGNADNLLTRFQALEYIASQNLDRRALELFNAIGVVPGAIGAWRKQAVQEAGGYSSDTLAEDADLTIALERLKWQVVSERHAVALTEAPETLRSFVKQRFRWTFGTLQVAYKHASALRGRPSGVSLITIPNIFVFQIAFALLAPLFDAVLLYTLAMVGIGSGQSETLLMLATYWLLFQTFDIAAVAIGIAINGERAAWRLLPLLVAQRFSYRQLLYVVTARAMLAAVKGRFIGWGKLIRTGNVVLPLTRSIPS